MRHLFLILVLLCAIQSQAQTLNINILFFDISNNKIPVADSEILLRNAKTNEVQEVKTNKQGKASLHVPIGTDFFIKTKYSNHKEYKISCATSPSNSEITLTHTDHSSAYYRNIQIQDSLTAIEIAKQEAIQNTLIAEEAKRQEKEDSLAEIAHQQQLKKEADLAKKALANPSKYGKHYFYAIGSIGFNNYYTIDVYTDTDKKVLINNVQGVYAAETCMASLANNTNYKPVLEQVGTYNYYAISGDGKYEWTGKYTITSKGSTATAFHIKDAKKVTKK